MSKQPSRGSKTVSLALPRGTHKAYIPCPSESSSGEACLDPGGRPAYSASMQATVNGERTELPEGLSVAALLRHLGVRAERVAVERNGAVVKRARHAEEILAPGDVLEIVTFVGGG